MNFKVSAVVLCLVMTAPAMANTSDQQTRVMDYCQQTSLPLLVAASMFVTKHASNVAPADARPEIQKYVSDSVEYKKASSTVKSAMDKVVTELANTGAMQAHQQAMMSQGERYLGVHAISWGMKTVGPFTAWCNYNHFER